MVMEGRRRRRQREPGFEFADCTSSCRFKFAASMQGLATTPMRSQRHRPPSLENLPTVPLDLLYKVLSQLSVKEAGRTSLLSSRWKNRWTNHSNLCFDGTSELSSYDADRFVNHVTAVLQHHSRLAVDRFEVRSPALGTQHTCHLDRWIGFASASKVKHLVLDLSPPSNYIHRIDEASKKYKFPEGSSSWISSTAISLALGNVCFELPIPDNGGFKMLKKLELKLVAGLGDLTPLLSNCHALEWLSINGSYVPHLVVPQIRNLHYLHVKNCGTKIIESHAMNLTTFEYIERCFVPVKVYQTGKLSKANIDICCWGCDTVNYFWDELSCLLTHVDRLFLTVCMDSKTTGLINNPIALFHLRYLTLFCNIVRNPHSELVVLRMTQILKAAPRLEHFVLHMDSCSREPLSLKTTNCIRPDVHHHHKTVHVTGMFGLSGQLELAKYILLSANALKLMTLNLAKNGNPDVAWEPNYKYLSKLAKTAKNYLDPLGVYRDVLKIGIGITSY